MSQSNTIPKVALLTALAATIASAQLPKKNTAPVTQTAPGPDASKAMPVGSWENYDIKTAGGNMLVFDHEKGTQVGTLREWR